MSAVDEIKSRWSLDGMANHLGLHIPERGKFCSPFRADENPSCERFGEVIKDRSTGETFDVIAIYAEVKGLSNADAIRQLRETVPSISNRPKPRPEPHKLIVPPLSYSFANGATVAASRGLSHEAVEFAALWLGTLGFADVCGHRSWVLTDASNRNAEARRFDGKLYPAFGDLGERKSHTLRGSCKAWPLGMVPPKLTVPPGLPVMLVEGGPDYLAACDVLMKSPRDYIPISMLGSGLAIHAEALPFFSGRRVLIAAHPDKAGQEAAKKWKAQLISAGADVRAKQLQGGDLNDLVEKHGAKPLAEEMKHELFN